MGDDAFARGVITGRRELEGAVLALQREKANLLEEVKMLRELLLEYAPTEAYRHAGTREVTTYADTYSIDEWGNFQKVLDEIREPKGQDDG